MKRLLCTLALVFASSSALASEFNFRFSPIGFLVGSINLNLDYVVAPQWTVGPEVRYWRFKLDSDSTFTKKYDITAYGFGARANWFKNGVYTDGFYIGPSLGYTNVKLETEDAAGAVSGTASALLASSLFGYGWFWDSFNMMLGGGFSVALGDTEVTVKDSSGTETKKASGLAGLALEFSLGWTF